jgi:hypothetical protein
MNPIEAAARAIYNADPQLGPDGPVPWDQQHTPLRAVCVAQARAAIEAIRDASDEMVVAAEAAVPKLACFDAKEASPGFIAWQAMIDAILADP